MRNRSLLSSPMCSATATMLFAQLMSGTRLIICSATTSISCYSTACSRTDRKLFRCLRLVSVLPAQGQSPLGDCSRHPRQLLRRGRLVPVYLCRPVACLRHRRPHGAHLRLAASDRSHAPPAGLPPPRSDRHAREFAAFCATCLLTF